MLSVTGHEKQALLEEAVWCLKIEALLEIKKHCLNGAKIDCRTTFGIKLYELVTAEQQITSHSILLHVVLPNVILLNVVEPLQYLTFLIIILLEMTGHSLKIPHTIILVKFSMF
jgi:hypothetical protein